MMVKNSHTKLGWKMNNLNYFEFDGVEKNMLLTKLQESFCLGRMMWEDPIKLPYITGGIIYGLEIPLKAIRALSNVFNQKDLYFLYQDMTKPEICDVSMLSEKWTSNNYPANICYLWTIENLIVFDLSYKWFVQFNSELSMGILVFRSDTPEYLFRSAIDAYHKHNMLINISEALTLVRNDLSNYGLLELLEFKMIKSYSGALVDKIS